MSSAWFYIIILLAIILAFTIIKKVASCLLKTLAFVLLLVFIGIIYLLFQ